MSVTVENGQVKKFTETDSGAISLDIAYKYNSDGNRVSQTIQSPTGLTNAKFTYDNANNPIKYELDKDFDGKPDYIESYKYNENNNVVLQTYCRDENKLNSKKVFELKKQYIISTDSFSYKKYDDSQTKKYYYNGYKKVFKEQTNYYNQYGYLTEEYTKFIIGNKKEKTTYEYDEIGRIYRIHNYTDIANDKKNTTVFNYDEIGNILDLKYYEESQHTFTKQFLYDKNMLLSAMIVQNIETSVLKIIKYRYTFYDTPIDGNGLE